MWSPWATVQTVTVTGLDRISRAQVRTITDTEIGRPMLLVGTSGLNAQLEELRLVKSVEVTRSWPSALRVSVTERQPVAAVPAGRVAASSVSGSSGEVSDDVVDAGTTTTGTTTTDGTDTDGSTADAGSEDTQRTVLMVELVDDDGVVVETVPAVTVSDSLPRVRVDLTSAQGVAGLRAAVAVVNSLPQALRSRVTAAGAESPDGVWLKMSAPLRDSPDRTVLVQWGDAQQNGQKSSVLTALLERQASTYDVRVPDMPSTAG